MPVQASLSQRGLLRRRKQQLMNDPCHIALFKHTHSSTSAVNCSFELDTERNIPLKKVRFSSAMKAALFNVATTGIQELHIPLLYV